MWAMFLFFLQLGFVSFGGGYALIPFIEQEALARGWMTHEAYVDSVTVAGMAPGPIAVNLGTIIGFRTYGIGGVLAALAGLVLPSLLMAAIIMYLIRRLRQTEWLGRLFYGLQPIVTALILFAVYRLGIGKAGGNLRDGHLLIGLGIVGICWMLLKKYRMHPISVLLFSAIGGAAFLS